MHADHELRRQFEEIVRGDRDLAYLLAEARELALPQWRVVAGCLYQTVWNVLTKKPARTGIKDYDLILPLLKMYLAWNRRRPIVECVFRAGSVHRGLLRRALSEYSGLRCMRAQRSKNAAILHAEAGASVMPRDVHSDDVDRRPPGTRQSCLQKEAVCGEAADNPCRVRDVSCSSDDIENTSRGRAASGSR
jgi:Nucleotidyltransferase